MRRHNMSTLEGEDSMQRTNRMVLGLMAVFVLGGALGLLSCGGGDETTDINASNATSLLGGRQYLFTAETDFGITVGATLAFNATATRFAVRAGSSRAVGAIRYGLCIFNVEASNFGAGTGPLEGLVVTVNTCQINNSEGNNLNLNDATSTSNGSTPITNFDPGNYLLGS